MGNQDNQVIQYSLNVLDNKLYRSIDGGPGVIFPTYSNLPGITIIGKGAVLFRYYDSNDTITAVAADIRRVAVDIIARTGSGAFNEWQGQSDLGSSVTVYPF